MLTHLVLMVPRPDLTPADRGALIDAFERAIREIDTVRDVRVGRRVVHGAHGECAGIDFDDLAGLQAYLRHPAHDQLGARFGQSLVGGGVRLRVEVEDLRAGRFF
jgi:hypothetical protein